MNGYNISDHNGAVYSEEPEKKTQTNTKWFLIGSCAALVMLILIVCLVVNAQRTINLNKYMTIDFHGYTGYG